jgi:hypothetical protein
MVGELKEIGEVILSKLPIDMRESNNFVYKTNNFELKMFYDYSYKCYSVIVSSKDRCIGYSIMVL